MTGPTKITKTIQGITFDSAYDNGSLKDIVSGGTDIFNGTLHTDTGEQGTAKYWFRFRLTGIAGRTILINLDHVENPRPFIRIGSGAWRRTTAAEVPSNSSMAFTFTSAQNEAEVAFFEPYGVEEIRQAVDSRVAVSDFAHETLIGATFEDRPLGMVTVEDPYYPSAGKKRVWVHSRVHAGEVTATHAMLGFLEQVLADNEAGRRLREHCIFTIVPMVNADGIARGHTRWDSQGIDPEREWCSVSIPEVQALKTQVDAFMAGPDPISVALNLHSTKGNYSNSFFFKHLAPSVSPSFVTLQQNYIDALDAETPLFNNASAQSSQLNACLFIESYFWNNWGESVMAMTHEGHFYRRQTDNEWITGADYREIGASLARALTTFYPLPAASEPALTYNTWVARSFAPIDQANPLITGETIDADGDGTVNLMEYALGRNPTIPDAGTAALQLIPVPGAPGSGLLLKSERSSYPADLDVFFEQSNDLANWTRIPASTPDPQQEAATLLTISGRRPGDGQAISKLELSIPSAAGTAGRFFRQAVRRL